MGHPGKRAASSTRADPKRVDRVLDMFYSIPINQTVGTMLANMRRLHSRGSTSRGIVVDVEGAMLGPDCALVLRGPHSYWTLAREEAAILQNFLFDGSDDP